MVVCVVLNLDYANLKKIFCSENYFHYIIVMRMRFYFCISFIFVQYVNGNSKENVIHYHENVAVKNMLRFCKAFFNFFCFWGEIWPS